LLIIECDSRKLATEGLDLGSAFGQIINTLFPEKRIAIAQTTSEEKLKEDLADVFKEHGRVRSILMVGHSNEVGLVLTADGLRRWGVVWNWLHKFEPEFCFLAACQAGKSEAVRDLFEPIKTLRQIYASPTALYKNQTPPLAVLIAMLLKTGRIDEDQSGALRLGKTGDRNTGDRHHVFWYCVRPWPRLPRLAIVDVAHPVTQRGNGQPFVSASEVSPSTPKPQP
jgi:hypothetical protein